MTEALCRHPSAAVILMGRELHCSTASVSVLTPEAARAPEQEPKADSRTPLSTDAELE